MFNVVLYSKTGRIEIWAWWRKILRFLIALIFNHWPFWNLSFLLVSSWKYKKLFKCYVFFFLNQSLCQNMVRLAHLAEQIKVCTLTTSLKSHFLSFWDFNWNVLMRKLLWNKLDDYFKKLNTVFDFVASAFEILTETFCWGSNILLQRKTTRKLSFCGIVRTFLFYF